jgi:sugar/nucleoside kinase (ribokinase family)
MIWDTIHGRDPAGGTVTEWGGIGYALAALDAALDPSWRVVPLVKVGRDLASDALRFLRDLRTPIADARFVEVPAINPRVELSYVDDERRCEGLTGGVPPWTWDELGPMVLGLDAIYANFITGFETDLATMQHLRRAYAGPIYGDVHSLALGRRPDGTRYYRPLEEALAWLECFDVVQMNEGEMAQLGAEPMTLAARAIGLGVGAVCVTLGSRGTVYLCAGDFDHLGWAGASRPSRAAGTGLVRTALVAGEDAPLRGDPTGCGDVFGGTLVARLLGGAALEPAVAAANRMAARNVSYRGAAGLQHHLRGALAPVLPA